MNLKIVLNSLVSILFASSAFAQSAPTLQQYCGVSAGMEDYAYSACVSRYHRLYDTINNNTMSGTTSTGVKPPSQPNYAQCSRTNPTTGEVTQDSVCTQQLQQQYQNDLARYQQIKAQEEAAAAAQLAQQKAYDSAKAAAEAAQRENDQAQKNYQLRQTLCSVTSMALAAAFTASCSGGVTCTWPLLAGSIAMGIYAGMAGGQANQHAVSEYQSCQKAGQLSASGSGDCGSAPGPFDPAGFPANTNPPITSVVDPNGKCIGDPALCKEIENNLPPGATLKDVAKGMNMFAAGKGPFKVNKDGSVTLGNGKKMTADDLSSYDKMVAAGMTPDQAKSLQDMLSKTGLGGLDAKSALAKENGGAGGGDGTLDGAAGRNAVAGGGGNGNDANGGLGANGKRGLASAEGLVKDFNGESIGVAGDNIWKMMNRRYRLKETQDSFLKVAKP